MCIFKFAQDTLALMGTDDKDQFNRNLPQFLDASNNQIIFVFVLTIFGGINLPYVVLVWIPTFAVSYVIYQFNLQKKIFEFGEAEIEPDLSTVITYSITKLVLLLITYIMVVHRELGIFFASQRDRRMNQNIETVFHCQKDFIFVIDET